MTGYGEARKQLGDIVAHVTLRTLNSKHLDIDIEAPKILHHQMPNWRKVLKKLERGKVNMEVHCSFRAFTPDLVQDKDIKACYTYIHALATDLGTTTDALGLAFRLLWKGTHAFSLNKKDQALIDTLIDKALKMCLQSREREGIQLTKQLQTCIALLEKSLKKLVDYAPQRKINLRKRLEERIKMREGLVDAQRWEQEVLYYLEKIDISEECVRLQSHILYMKRTMQEGGAVGKKNSFIVQEMLREINTIGAKAQDVEVQHLAVEMKQIVEQMKEQLRNIL